MSQADQILEAMDRVRPFPQVVVRALQLLDDPDVPARRLLEVIQYDPVITLRLLQVCNSAMFGLRRKVESLQQAMVLLGNQAMVRLLITFGALDMLKDPLPGYGLERGELWEHAVACATLSQSMLKELNHPEDHVVFTGAILHDVGKILLNEYAGRQCVQISKMVMEEDRSALEAEREVLGIDHAQLGRILAERWNLPQSILLIIGRHHEPVHPQRDPMSVCLVHLANLVCLQLGIGAGSRGLAARPSPELLGALGWSPRKIESCVSTFWCDMERVKALMDTSPDRRA
ncbi:MAG: HDOD domain-containing protein [Thermodesulfobacteriota bacterium]